MRTLIRSLPGSLTAGVGDQMGELISACSHGLVFSSIQWVLAIWYANTHTAVL